MKRLVPVKSVKMFRCVRPRNLDSSVLHSPPSKATRAWIKKSARRGRLTWKRQFSNRLRAVRNIQERETSKRNGKQQSGGTSQSEKIVGATRLVCETRRGRRDGGWLNPISFGVRGEPEEYASHPIDPRTVGPRGNTYVARLRAFTHEEPRRWKFQSAISILTRGWPSIAAHRQEAFNFMQIDDHRCKRRANTGGRYLGVDVWGRAGADARAAPRRVASLACY